MVGKIYSQIKFVMAEKLRKDLLDLSPKKEGLVAVKVSIASAPEYEIVDVKGSPTDFIKQLAKEDGLSQSKLNNAFKEAFG